MSKCIFFKWIAVFIFFNSFLGAELSTTVELRSAAFFHSSKLFRNIYGNVGTCYEIEVATKNQGCWETWVNYSQFSKKGKSDGHGCGKTRVNIYAISLGAHYIYPFCNCFEAYAGLGGSLSGVSVKNKAPSFHEKELKPAAGLVLKSGIVYYLSCNYFIDIFADYLYQPVHFRHRHVDVGGLKTGVGMGIRF